MAWLSVRLIIVVTRVSLRDVFFSICSENGQEQKQEQEQEQE